jgi:hypothetical protein
MKTSKVQKEKVKTPLCVQLQAQLISMSQKHALCLVYLATKNEMIRNDLKMTACTNLVSDIQMTVCTNHVRDIKISRFVTDSPTY